MDKEKVDKQTDKNMQSMINQVNTNINSLTSHLCACTNVLRQTAVSSRTR